MRTKRIWLIGALATMLVTVGLVLGLTTPSSAAKQRPKRDVYMSAVEWKGSASVAKEAYPGASSLPCSGSGCGYETFAPGSDEMKGDHSTWAIETYRFDTSTVTACAGDRLTMNIFGVNASHHDIVIPAFKKQFRVRRGVLSKVTMNVDKVGIYKILCITHPPAHQADLVVMNCGS